MSGERVNIIKDRAYAFLNLAKELIDRRPDIASFNIHQACQLRIKATLLRFTGEIPRIHSIRELLGILAKKLEDLNYREDALKIINFIRKQREILIDIEAAYTESRYGIGITTRSMIEEMLKTAEELFKLLDEVEKHVLG